jgi:hypothetical protein
MVMDTDMYEHKMRAILDNSTYTGLKKDPTKKVKRLVNDTTRHLDYTEEINS